MSNASATLVEEPAPVGPGSAEKQTARFLVLALLSVLLLFPSLLRPGLAGYDDAYWAHAGKEMARTGDWWSVVFNGDFTLEHPPLFPWLEAGSFRLLGANDA